MPLADYEKEVLMQIRDKCTPSDPGAAFWQAIEALVGGGYLKGGRLTGKGHEAIND